VLATKKGLNPLERGSQVQNMAEFEKILDFPPAPKLGIDGRLDPQKATARELNGQALFFGKARCGECHTGPHYTDGTLHDLQLERFFEPATINGIVSDAEGPMKTFTLRGLKESPPYFHDGRLLTIDDTIEFFNLVLQTRLTADEKRDLRAFLYTL
jgi:cytochrome c peroxidase